MKAFPGGGEGPVKLQSFPLRLDDIGCIIPLGNMQSGHVTSSDHIYFVPKGAMNEFQGNQRKGQGHLMDDRDFSRLYDVVAVADGFIIMLQWRPNPPGGQAKHDPTVFDRAVDLKVFIEHFACAAFDENLTSYKHPQNGIPALGTPSPLIPSQPRCNAGVGVYNITDPLNPVLRYRHAAIGAAPPGRNPPGRDTSALRKARSSLAQSLGGQRGMGMPVAPRRKEGAEMPEPGIGQAPARSPESLLLRVLLSPRCYQGNRVSGTPHNPARNPPILSKKLARISNRQDSAAG